MSDDIRPGQRVRDNDPRMTNRVMIVLRVEKGQAHLGMSNNSPRAVTKVSVSRIYTDGKPRRTGWSWVP